MAITAAVVLGIGGFMTVVNFTGGATEQVASRSGRQHQDWLERLNLRRQSTKDKLAQQAQQAADDAVAQADTLPSANPSTAMTPKTTSSAIDLSDPAKKEIAMELVSSAENSSLNWRDQFSYIEDIGDGRGYTGGIIGFCSGTGDMVEVVQNYTDDEPANPLAQFLPALKKVNGSDSHAGLGDAFVKAWKKAASDPKFQRAQEDERDKVYFTPAVSTAKKDGLHALGQFAYYDAAVMHGPEAGDGGLMDIRAAAMKKAKAPAQGGNETDYLKAFMDARKDEMAKEAAHSDFSRVDNAQMAFLKDGNLNLNTPLSWKMYGDPFSIKDVTTKL